MTKEEHGYALFGPYIPLRAGRFVAEFDVKKLSDGGTLHFDVSAKGGGRPHDLLGWSRIDRLDENFPSFHSCRIHRRRRNARRVARSGGSAALRDAILRIDQSN